MTTPRLSSFPHVGALILAAGKGTRMYSDTPKVLQTLLEKPLLHYVYEATTPTCAEQIWTVVGHKAEMVATAFPDLQQRFILQKQQLGTGHALQIAWNVIKEHPISYLLVINGDTPLLPAAILHSFASDCIAQQVDLGFLTLTLNDPASFGRVVRDSNEKIAAIIEAKDYSPSKYGPEPKEINAGIYCLRMESISPLLPQLTNKNQSGEFYITDLIGLAVKEKLHVAGIDQGNNPCLLGVNNPIELVRSEELLRAAKVEELLGSGVIIRQKESVRIGPEVVIEPGVSITGPCEIYGASHIAQGCTIESHCVLRNCKLDAGTLVKSFCHIDQTKVGNKAIIGPFARLRPGTLLEEEVHIGNFVEVKNSHLTHGVKAGHLSYIGDAEIGNNVNIGAGTITCNFDGKNKHKTCIEEGAFIGSNSSLVAPVKIGEYALIGAGSVITRNVPAEHLSLTRAKQTTLANHKKRQKE